MHSWAAMLIEIDKKQEIGLVTSCSKIKDNTLKWHDGIVCKYTDLKKKMNGNYECQSIQKKCYTYCTYIMKKVITLTIHNYEI